MPSSDRKHELLKGLNLHKTGIEISPLYRPTVRKEDGCVYYADYCSAEESRRKHADYEHDEIMEVDFVWTPGRRLRECVPHEYSFDWAISSHVLEHVPNPIGWLTEVFEVLNDGATFSIALPDKRYCYDKFRRTTDAADLIDAWIRDQAIPSPYQLFDFLSRSVDGSGEWGARAFDTADRFEDAKRHYTDKNALDFVLASWTTGDYFDVHCSAFTPDSFASVFKQIRDLGLLNIEISEPVVARDEFFIQLKKMGPPTIAHPGTLHASKDISLGISKDLEHAKMAFEEAVAVQNKLKNVSIGISKDLEHARMAFEEAVAVQNELKTELEIYRRFLKWMPRWMKRAGVQLVEK